MQYPPPPKKRLYHLDKIKNIYMAMCKCLIQRLSGRRQKYNKSLLIEGLGAGAGGSLSILSGFDPSACIFLLKNQ